MTVRLFEMFGMVFDLAHVKPFQCRNETSFIFALLRQAGFNERLGDESYIPELAAVGPGHHHTIRAEPQEVVPGVHVPLVRLALGPVDVRAYDEVHHLGHGAQCLISGVLVLVHYELVAFVKRGPSQGRECTRLVDTENHVQSVEHRVMRHVQVGGGDVVALSSPIDGIVVLWV